MNRICPARTVDRAPTGCPLREAPSGAGAAWLVATATAFQLGAPGLGYPLGGLMAIIAALVSATDLCIPSLIYRSVFGFPPKAPREFA